MRQHYLTPPPAPSTLNARLSPAIDAVLLRALAKQPDARFPSIGDFARSFAQAAQSSGELQATLAISSTEAETGTTRSLTLPGGQRVSVTVPAGVRDGSMLRLEGQGVPSSEGGPAGALLLTMRIVAAERPPSLSQTSTEPTLAGSMPTGPSPSVGETRPSAVGAYAPAPLEPTLPVSSSSQSGVAHTILSMQESTPPTEGAAPAYRTLPATQVARPAIAPPVTGRPVMGAAKPAKGKRSRRLILIGLVGLVVVALASGITWLTLHHAVHAGGITEFPLPTSQSLPLEITAGPDGNLWFTEYNGNKIGRITPTGSITEFPIPTAKSAPFGITAGPDGNLWFIENAGNKIGRITSGK